MKKVILFIGLLLVFQLSFSQTTVRYVILKADDLIDAGGSTGPGRLSSAWNEFNQMVIDKNIKANWGINGSQCNYSGSGSFWVEVNNLLSTGRFELWNHGYVHSPNPSNSDIVANQNLVKSKTGVTMIAFGAPENQSDAGTYASLNSLNDIEYIMYGSTASTSKTVWARDHNIESPIFEPNYSSFVSGYPAAIQKAASNGRDYLCLQMHPNMHTPYMGSRQTNLRNIIDYLKAQGLIFVTISEYKALHGGTNPPTTPSAPTNLTAAAGDTQVSLSWTASSGATSYNVLRSTTSGSGYTSVATGVSSTSYTNTGLTNSTTYYYVVSATNSAGTSGNSSQASATPVSCGTIVTWSNSAFTAQTGSFTAEFDVVPGGANMDGVVGLSNGAASAFTSLACAIQFATDGNIKARNGAAYAAANVVSYTAGTSYHVKMDVNVASKTYSVYVTPAGGSQQTLGSGYAFRTEQSTVTQLNNRSINTLACSLAVTNFTAGSVVTGLESIEELSNVSIFPNPTSGRFSLSVDQQLSGGNLMIIDVLGNKVLAKQLKGNTANLDLTGTPNGVYIINVVKDGKQMKSRFIKK